MLLKCKKLSITKEKCKNGNEIKSVKNLSDLTTGNASVGCLSIFKDV